MFASFIDNTFKAVKRFAFRLFGLENENEPTPGLRKRHLEDDGELAALHLYKRPCIERRGSFIEEMTDTDDFLLLPKALHKENSTPSPRRPLSEKLCTKRNEVMWVDANISSPRIGGGLDIKMKDTDEIQLMKVVAPTRARKSYYGQSEKTDFSNPRDGFTYPSKHKFEDITQASTYKGSDKLTMKNGLSSLKRSNVNSLSQSSSEGSLNSRKLLLLDESVRLDEKKKYSELLQSFTHVPVGMAKSTQTSRTRSATHLPASLLKAKVRNKEVEVIDLTKIADDDHKRKAGVSKTTIDVDIFCGPSNEKTKEPLDSISVFKQKIDKCPVYDITWTAEFLGMYNRKDRENRMREQEMKLKSELGKRNSELMLNHILEERMRCHMRITEVAVEETPIPYDDEEEKKLPEFTQSMEKRVALAFRAGPGSEVLVEGFGQRITRRDIQTLVGINWLNDEVINFYMNLLIERGKLDNYPTVYCFNTFFYPKLAQTGHASLKRWTRKIDVFAHDILIVPVHLGVHWCLACIKFTEKQILYFDSMGSPNDTCLRNLMRYLCEESQDKKKKTFDTSGWNLINIRDNPQQLNGSDCGMFSCMYAEYICRRAKITFSQRDMPYFRRKMAYEILIKKLLL